MRRRSAFSLFWGPPLLGLGVLLLLNVPDPWGWFWPLLAIWAGAWLIGWPRARRLLAGTTNAAPAAAEDWLEVALNGAQQGLLTMKADASAIQVRGGAPSRKAARINADGLLDSRTTLVDGRLVMYLTLGPRTPWLSNDWQVELSEAVPWNLRLEAGMGRLHLDLRSLRVAELQLEGGMTQVDLTCPEEGESHMRLEMGLSHLTVRVPPRVAVYMTLRGMGRHEVDRDTFQLREDGLYVHEPESPDGRLHLYIENGLGTVRVVQE